jgi:hypothetical protein
MFSPKMKAAPIKTVLAAYGQMCFGAGMFPLKSVYEANEISVDGAPWEVGVVAVCKPGLSIMMTTCGMNAFADSRSSVLSIDNSPMRLEHQRFTFRFLIELP